ncbi:MAG: SEFIR domain-containing protein [Acidobacteriota bacterium]
MHFLDLGERSVGEKAPRVFISYSHDSVEHVKWVFDLAKRLREHGIEASIDQYKPRGRDPRP